MSIKLEYLYYTSWLSCGITMKNVKSHIALLTDGEPKESLRQLIIFFFHTIFFHTIFIHSVLL